MKNYICCMDVALASCGYAIFEKETQTLVEVGTIKTNKEDKIGVRLTQIFEKLEILNIKYNFSEIAKERIYVSSFYKSSEQLLRVHGIIEMLFSELPLFEYSPRTIKKIVTGSGKADKKEVAKAVKKYYDLEFKNEDESDAVACGITHFLVQR